VCDVSQRPGRFVMINGILFSKIRQSAIQVSVL
jgi:hypothetical protein